MIWRSEKRRLVGVVLEYLKEAANSFRTLGTSEAFAPGSVANLHKKWYGSAAVPAFCCVTVVAPFSNISTSKRQT